MSRKKRGARVFNEGKKEATVRGGVLTVAYKLEKKEGRVNRTGSCRRKKLEGADSRTRFRST